MVVRGGDGDDGGEGDGGGEVKKPRRASKSAWFELGMGESPVFSSEFVN